MFDLKNCFLKRKNVLFWRFWAHFVIWLVDIFEISEILQMLFWLPLSMNFAKKVAALPHAENAFTDYWYYFLICRIKWP
jgi:hypothetical protein